MNRMRLSLTIAASTATMLAAAGNAQAWQPQSGVMPSYRTAPPKVTKRIDGQDGLNAALANARGGEVLGLAPGGYAIQLSGRSFASPVVITSANPAKPAKIGWIKLEDVSNLTFTRLEIARAAKPGESVEGAYIGKVGGGSNITFDSVWVHGSLDDDPSNDVTGISIGGTKNARVINSEFEQLGRAVVFGAIRNSVIANNKIHDIRSDGFDFAQSNNVLIEGNHFSASHRVAKDHPDGIQFWTRNTKRPSTDIIIRNNQIMQGHGSGMQGIFMRDETENMPFERITIENNLILGSNMANGIFIANGRQLKILNNTVVSPTDDKNPVWIKLISVHDVTFEGNIADVGGNKSPDRAKIKMSLLKTKRFRDLAPDDLVVPGIGYQLTPATGN